MYPNQYISKLLETAINNELKDNQFYINMANSTVDSDNQKIFMDIGMDEEKHSKILTDLYTKLNGSYPETENINIDIDSDFLTNIYNAILDETNAVENYRVLLFAFDKPEYKNAITEIILDEQNHAAKLNYLYSKNK
jgi:hypothetical protein